MVFCDYVLEIIRWGSNKKAPPDGRGFYSILAGSNYPRSSGNTRASPPTIKMMWLVAIMNF